MKSGRLLAEMLVKVPNKVKEWWPIRDAGGMALICYSNLLPFIELILLRIHSWAIHVKMGE